MVASVEAPAAAAREASQTVLLVDDQEGVRVLIREVLQRSGYGVLEAKSGPEALGMCREFGGPIDLLVSDVTMAGMNGRQLLAKLRERFPAVKVLFVSGYPFDEVKERGLLDDPATFLPKPFSPGELARKVRELLGR